MPWYEFLQFRYYAVIEGTKAHSWDDAAKRCGRITNGHAFPIIIRSEIPIAVYLSEEYVRLNITPGKQ